MSNQDHQSATNPEEQYMINNAGQFVIILTDDKGMVTDTLRCEKGKEPVSDPQASNIVVMMFAERLSKEAFYQRLEMHDPSVPFNPIAWQKPFLRKEL
jgi:hypothetical protein